MTLEVLRAKLQAAGNLKSELLDSAAAAQTTGSSLDDLSDDAAQSSASVSAIRGRLDALKSESLQSSGAIEVLKQRVESLGDEFTQSAIKSKAFDASLDGIETGDLAANIGGLSGSVGQLAAVAAAAAPAIFGLGSALGGIGVGGAGLGAGAIGLTAAGIQSRAEQTASLSSELENAAAAREQLLGNFKSQLSAAFEPLQNAQTEQFALANLTAVIQIAENAAGSLRGLQASLIDVGAAFRETIVATSGDLFGSVTAQVDRLSPLLLQLRGAIRDLPALITFLGDAAVRIGPQLFNLAAALGPALLGITDLGIAIADTLLPVINPLLFVVGRLGAIFAAIPGPLQNAAVAFALTTGVIALYGSVAGAATAATTALIGAITTLTAPISVTAIAIGALVGAAVALAAKFGLLDAIFGAVKATWNGLVELVEFGINAFVGIAKAAADVAGPFLFLLGPIGALLFLIGNFNEILDATTNIIDAVVQKIKDLARIAGQVLGPVLDAVDAVASGVDQQGGVQLDAAKAGGGDDGGDGSNRPQQPSSGPPRPGQPQQPGQRGQGRKRGAQAAGGGGGATYDFSGADFSGSDPTRTKEQIKRAVEDANKSSRNAEEGRVE